MDPRIFSKEDAPSILVIEKPWKDVLDKPILFDEVAERVIDMMQAAQGKYLTRADTLRKLKEVMNEVLLTPLQKDIEVEPTGDSDLGDSILVDAFWEEIPGIPPDLKIALERLLMMKEQIDEHLTNRLDSKSTLMDTKTMVNDTVLDPLNGINRDY